MTNRHLIKNTILLTVFSAFMRLIGLAFQLFLSNTLGTTGIGLFQLVMSVNALAITVATSGVRFAVTRLVAEVLGQGLRQDVKRVMKCCFAYAAFFGLLAFGLVFTNAAMLARHWAGDPRCEIPIRILALGLPFIAFSTVIGGYFTAVGRVGRAALIQLAEQLIMIAASFYLLRGTPDMVQGCSAIAGASVWADGITCAIALAVFALDIRRYGRGKSSRKYLSRLLGISLPLALSAYARTALSTLQHMLTPAGLKKSGATADEALSIYGTIHGIVFPILVFPSALFNSLAELLIPTLTEHQVSGNTAMVDQTVNHILRLCLSFSICCAAVLFAFGEPLGQLLHPHSNAGGYIRMLAPLVIIMYMDTITDGMLKGLGQQLFSMGVNIVDTAISLVMVFTLLPLYAIKAYIFIIFFSECFNFSLSILRLSKLARIRLRPVDLLRPFLCSLAAVNGSQLLMNFLHIPPSLPSLFAAITLAAGLYALLTRTLSSLTGAEKVRAGL